MGKRVINMSSHLSARWLKALEHKPGKEKVENEMSLKPKKLHN